MVGFLRKKKSDKTGLSDDTILERKGRVDGASLLDDNGDATHGTLYNQNNMALKKGGRNYNDEENNAPHPPPQQQFPPQNYPYGQTYPPQNGYGYPPQQPVGAFGQQPNGQSNNMGAYGGNASFGNNSRGNFGQAPPQQQYPVQYGNNGNQPQYPTQQGNQPQYPQQYGNYPPPFQPQQPKKSSFFRIPGYSKK